MMRCAAKIMSMDMFTKFLKSVLTGAPPTKLIIREKTEASTKDTVRRIS